MVERKTLNLVVVGSIPTGGAFLLTVTLEVVVGSVFDSIIAPVA